MRPFVRFADYTAKWTARSEFPITGLLNRFAEHQPSAEPACPTGRITSEYAVIGKESQPIYAAKASVEVLVPSR
ncbi:MAG: hypothetical protein DMG32_27320 [Acidobacteria bacterium]|nr:MAG: hypothetical protein DMG32_27320 [Acidobacteriota bacterium]